MKAISDKVEEHKEQRAKQTEWTFLFKDRAKTPVIKKDLQPLDQHLERIYKIKQI